jgi:integrase
MAVIERPKGSGVWWASWFDKDGIRRRKKIGAKSEAQKRYTKEKANALAGRPTLAVERRAKAQGQGVKLGELIDDVLLFVKKKGHKDQRTYPSKAEMVRPVFGGQVAADISPLDLENWLAGRFKTEATRNRYKAFLSLCYREGIRNSKVTHNIARGILTFTEPEGRIRFLNTKKEDGPLEYEHLYKKIHDRFPANLPKFVVSVRTGMRHTEQLTRTWGDFHPERAMIDGYMKKHGKRVRRDVKLDPISLKMLLSIRPANWKPTDMVFPKPEDGAPNGQERWFEICCVEAGVAKYTWHCNRHTFCSWMAMSGAGIKEIQEAAGHASITMSAKYMHLSPSHVEAAVNRLAVFQGEVAV